MQPWMLGLLAQGNSVEFIGATAASGDTSLTMNYPAGTQDGDLAIMQVYAGRNTLSSSQSGWAAVYAGTSFERCWWQTVSGLSPVSINEGGAGPFVASIAVFRNAALGQVADGSDQSNRPDPKQITGVKGGSIVLVFAGSTADSFVQTTPAGYTEVAQDRRSYTYGVSLIAMINEAPVAAENPGTTTGSSISFPKAVTIEVELAG